MDRKFLRQLVEFARQPKARDIFHDMLRQVAELTGRGRKPSDKELDALVVLIEARMEAEAEANAAEKSEAAKTLAADGPAR